MCAYASEIKEFNSTTANVRLFKRHIRSEDLNQSAVKKKVVFYVVVTYIV